MFKHVCLLQKLLVAFPNKDNMLFQQFFKKDLIALFATLSFQDEN